MKWPGRIVSWGILMFLLAIPARLWGAEPYGWDQRELVLLELTVNRHLNIDFDAFQYKGELYIPILTLLDELSISATLHTNGLVVHFPEPKEPAKIAFSKQTFQGVNGEFSYTTDQLVHWEDELYLQTELVQQLLGFQLDYDVRALRLYLQSPYPLPIIKNLERKQRYVSFSPQKPRVVPEDTIPGRHPRLAGFTTDWALSNSYTPLRSTHFYRLGMGGYLLGGDFKIRGAGTLMDPNDNHQLRGQWRYPFYSSPFIKQLQVGDLRHFLHTGPQPDTFRGVSISNRPLAPRRKFSTYQAEGSLIPGWDAEMHINSQLHNFAIGDQVRRYQFSAPLQYGTNSIQHFTYSPSGERAIQREYMIHIPQQFLPPGTFQYTLSAGQYHNHGQDFGRLDLQWGLSSFITVGGGASGVIQNKEAQVLPSLQAWFRPGHPFMATASHSFGQYTEATLRGIWASSRSLMVSLQKHHSRSLFNRTGKDLELLGNISQPVQLPAFRLSMFTSGRFTRYRTLARTAHFYYGVQGRLPYQLNWRINSRTFFSSYNSGPLIASQWSVESQLTKRIYRWMLRPSVRYDYRLGKVSGYQLKIGRRMGAEGNLDLHYQRNLVMGTGQVLLSYRLNLPFAHHSSTARSAAGSFYGTQHTSGSFRVSRERSFLFESHSSIGQAVIMLSPFLDSNGNGKKDNGEPEAEGLTADLYRPGQHLPSVRRKELFNNLIAYEEYLIKVNQTSVENPLWRASSATLLVQAMPGMVTTVPVPIVVTGEIAGRITSDQPSPGLSGIGIHILDSQDTLVKSIYSYGDGRFYYVGLKPGTYRAMLNEEELTSQGLQPVVRTIPFTIISHPEGDIVEGLIFKVAPVREDNRNDK